MATVTRVLPWRRNSAPPSVEVAPLVATYRSRHPKADPAAIDPGLRGGASGPTPRQVRTSGEPYITHPLGGGRRSSPTSASTTSPSPPPSCTTRSRTPSSRSSDVERELRRRRWPPSSTASPSSTGSSSTPRRPSRPPRCARCWWRWPRTSGSCSSSSPTGSTTCARSRRCPSAKQQRIAQETLDIYAPLAHRLGMQDMKWQLEDLAFAALHPKRYAEIEQMVATRAPERELYLAQVLEEVRAPPGRAAHRRRGHAAARSTTGRSTRRWSCKGKAVRRHLRPRRHPGRRRLGEGLLRRARLDPRDVEAGAGPVQGLHRHAQVQPLPVAAHDGGGPAGQAARGADPHPGDAPAGRVRRRRPLGLQGATSSPTDLAWLQRIVDWQQETSTRTSSWRR